MLKPKDVQPGAVFVSTLSFLPGYIKVLSVGIDQEYQVPVVHFHRGTSLFQSKARSIISMMPLSSFCEIAKPRRPGMRAGANVR